MDFLADILRTVQGQSEDNYNQNLANDNQNQGHDDAKQRVNDRKKKERCRKILADPFNFYN